LAAANLDTAKLHSLRDMADEVDVQKPIFKSRPIHFDMVFQTHTKLERPFRDGMVKIFLLGDLSLFAGHREKVLLRRDRDLLG